MLPCHACASSDYYIGKDKEELEPGLAPEKGLHQNSAYYQAGEGTQRDKITIGGEIAKKMGVEGVADGRTFESLFNGFNPHSGEKLRQSAMTTRERKEKTVDREKKISKAEEDLFKCVRDQDMFRKAMSEIEKTTEGMTEAERNAARHPELKITYEEIGRRLGMRESNQPVIERRLARAEQKLDKPGMDFAISAPQDWAMAWAAADEKTREKMDEAERLASAELTKKMEDYAYARIGKGGRELVKADGLVVADVRHFSSRPANAKDLEGKKEIRAEANKHTHKVVMNTTTYQGKTLAVDYGVLMDGRTRTMLDAFYQARLIHHARQNGVIRKSADNDKELDGGLALRINEKQKGETATKGVRHFQLAAVRDARAVGKRSDGTFGKIAINEHFGARAKEIKKYEEELARQGITGDKQLAKTGSRMDKSDEWDREAVIDHNGSLLRDRFGLTESVMRKTAGDEIKAHGLGKGRIDENDWARRLESSLCDLDVFMTERQVEMKLWEQAQYHDDLDVPAVMAEMRKSGMLMSTRDLGLSDDQQAKLDATFKPAPGEALLTTRTALENSVRIHDNLRAIRENCAVPKADRALFERVLRAEEAAKTRDPDKPFRFNDKQIEYAWRGTQGAAVAAQAYAGTGKTTTAKVIVDVFLEQMRERGVKEPEKMVFGIAPSGKASVQLGADTRLPASQTFTVEKLDLLVKMGAREIPEGSLFLVDEAMMAGSGHLRAITDLVSSTKSKLIVQGDLRQLQPVQAGAPVRVAMEHGLFDICGIDKISRQRDDLMKHASEAASRGDFKGALKVYEDKGAIRTFRGADETLVGAVKGYLDDKAAAGEKIIAVETNAAAEAANEMVRAAKIAGGEIRGERTMVVSKDGVKTMMSIGENDRLMIRDNAKDAAGLEIKNGQMGTVSGFTGRGEIVLRLDGETADRVIPRSMTALDRCYAATTHKLQGATVKSVHAVYEGGGSGLAVVQMTRHTDTLSIYVSAKNRGRMAEMMSKDTAKIDLSDLMGVERQREILRRFDEMRKNPITHRIKEAAREAGDLALAKGRELIEKAAGMLDARIAADRLIAAARGKAKAGGGSDTAKEIDGKGKKTDRATEKDDSSSRTLQENHERHLREERARLEREKADKAEGGKGGKGTEDEKSRTPDEKIEAMAGRWADKNWLEARRDAYAALERGIGDLDPRFAKEAYENLQALDAMMAARDPRQVYGTAADAMARPLSALLGETPKETKAEQAKSEGLPEQQKAQERKPIDEPVKSETPAGQPKERTQADLDKSLFEAVSERDMAKARDAVAAGANPNARDAGKGDTPLHHAARKSDNEMAKALIDAGADPAAKNDKGVSVESVANLAAKTKVGEAGRQTLATIQGALAGKTPPQHVFGATPQARREAMSWLLEKGVHSDRFANLKNDKGTLNAVLAYGESRAKNITSGNLSQGQIATLAKGEAAFREMVVDRNMTIERASLGIKDMPGVGSYAVVVGEVRKDNRGGVENVAVAFDDKKNVFGESAGQTSVARLLDGHDNLTVVVRNKSNEGDQNKIGVPSITKTLPDGEKVAFRKGDPEGNARAAGILSGMPAPAKLPALEDKSQTGIPAENEKTVLPELELPKSPINKNAETNGLVFDKLMNIVDKIESSSKARTPAEIEAAHAKGAADLLKALGKSDGLFNKVMEKVEKAAGMLGIGKDGKEDDNPVDIKDPASGATALHLVAQLVSRGDLPQYKADTAIKVLLKAGADEYATTRDRKDSDGGIVKGDTPAEIVAKYTRDKDTASEIVRELGETGESGSMLAMTRQRIEKIGTNLKIHKHAKDTKADMERQNGGGIQKASSMKDVSGSIVGVDAHAGALYVKDRDGRIVLVETRGGREAAEIFQASRDAGGSLSFNVSKGRFSFGDGSGQRFKIERNGDSLSLAGGQGRNLREQAMGRTPEGRAALAAEKASSAAGAPGAATKAAANAPTLK